MSAAIILLVAMFALLVNFDGQAVPNWGLSLNLSTLLAMMSTIFRATILLVLSQTIAQAKWYWLSGSKKRPLLDIQAFDLGSRRALGAISLIPTTAKDSLPITLAAALSAISIATGPFVQQSIGTTTCLRQVPGTATLPFAHYVPRQGGHCRSCMPGALDADAENMLFSALTYPEEANINQIQMSCTTGNCTFPNGDLLDGDSSNDNATYSTIGLCHRCINTTSLVTYTNDPSSMDHAYTLPTGQGVGISTITWNFDKFPTVLTTMTHENITWMDDLITPEFKHASRWAFVNITVMLTSDVGCDRKTGYCPSPGLMPSTTMNGSTNVRAATCLLYPCVRTYTTSISNNHLSEKLVGSALAFPELLSGPKWSPLPTISDIASRVEATNGASNRFYHYGAVHSPCNVRNETNSSQNTPPTSAATRLVLCMPTDDGKCDITEVSAPEHCIYRQNAQFALGEVVYLQKRFNNRSCVLGQAFSCGESESENKWMQRLYHPLKPIGPGPSSRGDATFESIDGFIRSFANSVTNHYRSTYGTAVFNKSDTNDLIYPLDEVVGIAWQTSICTAVHLWWLLPLVGAAITTLLLLVWVISRSWRSRHELPAWKESLLPLVFYGALLKPDDIMIKVQEHSRLTGTIKVDETKAMRLMEKTEMERLAGKLLMRLQPMERDR